MTPRRIEGGALKGARRMARTSDGRARLAMTLEASQTAVESIDRLVALGVPGQSYAQERAVYEHNIRVLTDLLGELAA